MKQLREERVLEVSDQKAAAPRPPSLSADKAGPYAAEVKAVLAALLDIASAEKTTFPRQGMTWALKSAQPVRTSLEGVSISCLFGDRR